MNEDPICLIFTTRTKLSITNEKNCVQLINAISDAFVKAYISEIETVEEGRM